jgi:hypothetical protein
MRYLENALKFTFNNILLALPLLISMAIPALIINIGTAGFSVMFMQKYMQFVREAVENNGQFYGFNPDFFNNMVNEKMVICIVISVVLYIFFAIIVYPATYGLINKKYETGIANFNDFSSSLSKYIGRFVQYGLLSIAIDIGASVVFSILIGIAVVVIIMVNRVAGVLLILLFSLAFIVGVITLRTYMSLWFPAVCTEDSGIVRGLKNSFKYVNGSFWLILGITILISLAGNMAGWMFGLFPIIGSVITSVISTLVQYVKIVFSFEIYRQKTGRFNNPEPEQFQQFNGEF